MKLPLIAPRPPRLSEMGDALRALEASGYYSNGGPIVREFERSAIAGLFGGEGQCVAVGNATLGLMLAIREARMGRGGRYALVPAFTFAATAHAAIWAGLIPILVDSDPGDWAMSAAAEEALLAHYGDEIAVIVPYDTFGVGIDLAHYQTLSERYGVGVVIDAAASLGSLDAAGRGFGTGARFSCVFSMHATKTFATAEGGLIYSADSHRMTVLRRMQNFGFGAPRTATQEGINAKLPEILGLLALEKLKEIDKVADHRAALERAYRERLDGFALQASHARRQVAQFMPLLLPAGSDRRAIMAEMAAKGIGSGHYFSPHIGEQPYFHQACITGSTPVADDIAARMLSLPITDAMTFADVATICDALHGAVANPQMQVAASPAPQRVRTVLIGGGPAGIALLISASKQSRLRALADGLVVVERSQRLGSGELPGYGITSDSTAETFLSAVKDNPEPAIAALVDHPGAQDVARFVGRLGVPLDRTGPFLEAIGERVGAIVREGGGEVCLGHEVSEARRTPAGLWQVTMRNRAGSERTLLADNIVIATGGYQSPTGVAAARVAGMPLAEHVGERLMLGDDVLRSGGVDRLRARLGETRAPRVAIVGASTSAIASAVLLLKSGIPFGAGGLTLLHREPLRPWYPNADAARADGFTDFGEQDICPLSGFVYRLAGFRLEARELVLRMLEIGGRTPDPRVRFHHLAPGEDPAAAAILDGADVTVAALGYRPHALPLFDAAGARIALAAHAPGRPRLADQQCRVIDAHGQPIAGAYGIGLAAGFVPEGRLGGEPSFKGKANGLWQWQNDVGQLIVGQLLGQRVRAAA